MIGISLLTLAPGRMGGSESYVRALLAALRDVGSLNYLVAAPPDALDAACGLRYVAAGAPGTASRLQTLVAAAAARDVLGEAHVIHYPLTVPLPGSRAPRVVTLHDVLHRDQPALVSRAVRTFRRVAYDAAARRSQLVIVPSRFVQKRAVVRLGLDPGRVRVVHHGVDRSVFHPGPESREPFILYPARFWPHKNHRLLFDAFRLVRLERPELELVLTGGGHAGMSLPQGVRSMGLVSESELARLYRTAETMVFPSLYEGFGSPILEAMASGCPVAASDVASVPEVAADAAVLFNPRSADSIADGIRRALEEPARLAEYGVARAAQFTWAAAARAHDAAFRELLG